jgi:hypothetical protein
MAIENALKELALAAAQDVLERRSSPLDDELVERLANVTNLRFMEHPAFERAALELIRDPALGPFSLGGISPTHMFCFPAGRAAFLER